MPDTHKKPTIYYVDAPGNPGWNERKQGLEKDYDVIPFATIDKLYTYTGPALDKNAPYAIVAAYVEGQPPFRINALEDAAKKAHIPFVSFPVKAKGGPIIMQGSQEDLVRTIITGFETQHSELVERQL